VKKLLTDRGSGKDSFYPEEEQLKSFPGKFTAYFLQLKEWKAY